MQVPQQLDGFAHIVVKRQSKECLVYPASSQRVTALQSLKATQDLAIQHTSEPSTASYFKFS
eukprot:982523-Pelagomonas_calceolata.AAC.1